MSTTKAIIFDLDGVLIDSLPIHYKSYVKLYSEYGIRYPFSEFVSRDITAGAMNAIPRVLKEHGVRADWKEAIKTKNSLMKGIPIKLHKGVLPLLKSLKKNGYKLAVASGGTHDFVHGILKKSDIRKYFDAVITGQDNVKKKPHPDIFLKTAKKLGVKPRECVVIEDSHDGVIAAKRAKMKAVGHYRPRYGQNLSEADKVVRSMAQIGVKMIGNM